jgi:iron(III) transport system substrate-binding protein
MRVIHSRCGSILSSFFALFLYAHPVTAQTEEKILKKSINCPKRNAARLIAGAEGAVTWYVAMNRTFAQDLINGFEARYPFSKSTRSPVAAACSRSTDGAPGQVEYLRRFNTRSMTVNTLRKAGAIARYRSPLRASLRDGFADKEGFVNGIFATPLVYIYNSKLVNRKEMPTSIEELTQPKWLGKMAVDDESYDWLAALMDYYGEAKGLELAAKVANSNCSAARRP